MQLSRTSKLWNRVSANRRGVFAIVFGTAGGQLVALIGAPLLSRTYSPSDFGILTVCTSLALVWGAIAAMRIELAVPLPVCDKEARSLVRLGLLSTLIVGIIGSVCVFFFGHLISRAFLNADMMPWLYTVPIVGGLIAAFAALNQLAIRKRRFAAIGRRSFVQAVSTMAVQASVGVASAGPAGLLAGLAIGQAVGVGSLLRGSQVAGKEARFTWVPLTLFNLLKEYRRFPLILAPAGLLNILGLQVPILLFAYYYGANAAGWLGLTQRTLALPIALLGTAIAQVYLAEVSASARDRPAQCYGLFVSASKKLYGLGFAAGVAVVVGGPAIFSTIFGSPWERSGQYAQALAINLAMQFVAAPLSQTLVVLGRSLPQFVWDSSRLVSVAAAVAIAAQLGVSDITAMWIMGVVSAATYVAAWLLSLVAVREATKASRWKSLEGV